MSNITRKIKSFGKDIWEEKIKKQDEVGVIFGTMANIGGKGKEKVHKQTKQIMKAIDKEVIPLIKPKGNILDAGTGPMARFSIAFAKRGFTVTGVDISKTTLKFAKKYIDETKTTKIKLKEGDMIDLNLKEKFDLVFCVETFFHIPKHCSLLVLKNFNNMLNNGGYLLLGLYIKKEKTTHQMLFESAYFTIHKIKKRLNKGFSVTHSVYTEDELKDLFLRTGFEFKKQIDGLWLLKKVKDIKTL